jgi:hypothetical protein
VQQGDAAEGEEDARLVEAEHLEAAVVRVGEDDGLEGLFVDIVGLLKTGLANITRTACGRLRVAAIRIRTPDGLPDDLDACFLGGMV